MPYDTYFYPFRFPHSITEAIADEDISGTGVPSGKTPSGPTALANPDVKDMH
jgi:hypothetical protein